ncbi:MAG: hypothetical protein EXR72_24755 [Myxococcales bacterium]|nr:hypothetical protein [Myxococcales bacterium]
MPSLRTGRLRLRLRLRDEQEPVRGPPPLLSTLAVAGRLTSAVGAGNRWERRTRDMAQIEIAPLSERLGDDEIVELAGGLESLGAPRLAKSSDDNPIPVGQPIDDDVLSEFLDRLEAHDVACEIYLPVEFEGRVEVADLRVGSAVALLEVLEELKDELGIDADDDADDADDADDDALLLDAKLRHVWKLLYDGASSAVERHLPLHLQS